MFAALGNKTYRLYFAGGAVSNIGAWVQRIGQDWLVLQIGGATALGITTGLQFLPFLLLSPLGGMLADRFPKRKILMCTQVTNLVLAAALGALTLSGHVVTWHVYVLALLFGVSGALDSPARQSFAVEMVGKDNVANAIGLNSASFNAARLCGPGIAGLLLVAMGTGLTLLLNALTYAGLFIALMKIRPQDLVSPEPISRAKGAFKEGISYIRGRSDLVLVMATVGFVAAFGLNMQLTSALMATEVFGKGAGEFGVLGSIVAIGTLAGALVAARRQRTRVRLIVVSGLLFSLSLVVAGLMPTYWTYAAVLPIAGFTSMTMITAANSIMQLKVEPAMRGRVTSIYMMVFLGSTPIGSPLVGWIGQEFGARWTLLLGGAISVVGALGASFVLSRTRGLVVRAHVLPRPHLHVFNEPDYADRMAELKTREGRLAVRPIERLLTGGDNYLARLTRSRRGPKPSAPLTTAPAGKARQPASSRESRSRSGRKGSTPALQH